MTILLEYGCQGHPRKRTPSHNGHVGFDDKIMCQLQRFPCRWFLELVHILDQDCYGLRFTQSSGYKWQMAMKAAISPSQVLSNPAQSEDGMNGMLWDTSALAQEIKEFLTARGELETRWAAVDDVDLSVQAWFLLWPSGKAEFLARVFELHVAGG